MAQNAKCSAQKKLLETREVAEKSLRNLWKALVQSDFFGGWGKSLKSPGSRVQSPESRSSPDFRICQLGQA